MRWTCKCGAINVVHVNPLSFNSGAIFSECQACKTHHLIKDNMNLVHTIRYGDNAQVAPSGKLLGLVKGTFNNHLPEDDDDDVSKLGRLAN